MATFCLCQCDCSLVSRGCEHLEDLHSAGFSGRTLSKLLRSYPLAVREPRLAESCRVKTQL